jgi:trimeric autotransporter adhesin
MAVTTSRAAALNLTTDLAQAGAVFNDATRLLDGGLWSTPNDANGQQAYLGSFTADIHAVLNGITADLAQGATVTVGGTPYTLTAADVSALQNVQTALNDMLTQAPLSTGHGHAAAAAQQALHADDAAVLAAINNDAGLATALTNASYGATTGSTDVGFQNSPVGSDNAAAISAATAAGASLAQISAVFNAATDLAVGGLNHSNMAEFTADMKAVATGVQNILNSPTQLAAIEHGETANAAALTTIHLQTVEDQINLQLNKFDGEYATNPNVAARATNDNLLDIIDIIQNDANLNMNAGGNGTPSATGGFAELPGYLSGTITHFQDNQGQTNFWAQFLSEANVINNQLNATANGTSTMSVSSLITEIQNYQKFGASFDTSQGGTFGARFDNELLGGTLLADTKAAVHGLQGIMNGDTGTALAADKAQIVAAGQGFAADAMDVSGNNNPFGGGTYVGTATTVAGATSIAGLAQGTIPVGPVANGSTGLSSSGSPGNAGGGFGDGGAGHGMPVVDPGHGWHWG